MGKAVKAKGGVRYDNKHVRLQTGETQRSDGSYMYRWTDDHGVRHSVYGSTLELLREKEKQILVDLHDGIRADKQTMTVNDMYDLWRDIKRGVRGTTMSNYIYYYDRYVHDGFGQKRIAAVKKSDVRKFYNSLHDDKMLKINSIDSVHTVLHQVFQTAVDDNIIRSNPTDNMLRELKMSRESDFEARNAMTADQQSLFQDYMLRKPLYRHWYPIFFVMANTGMRVGEVIGLRWQDVDMEKGIINVNHNVVYYSHKGNGQKCHYAIHSTKSRAGVRLIPMTQAVKDAFLMEKEYQELTGIHNTMSVDGYTDFIFTNTNGSMHNLTMLNKALKRLTRDCNDELIEKYGIDNVPVLLPNLSTHILRHTFATRLCESGVNIKLAQSILGHADISTTMNIYVTVTEDMRNKGLQDLEDYLDIMDRNDTELKRE